jgi:hypothetical protein
MSLTLILLKEELQSDDLDRLLALNPIELTKDAFLVDGNALLIYATLGPPKGAVVVDFGFPGSVHGVDGDEEKKIETALVQNFWASVETQKQMTE